MSVPNELQSLINNYIRVLEAPHRSQLAQVCEELLMYATKPHLFFKYDFIKSRWEVNKGVMINNIIKRVFLYPSDGVQIPQCCYDAFKNMGPDLSRSITVTIGNYTDQWVSKSVSWEDESIVYPKPKTEWRINELGCVKNCGRVIYKAGSLSKKKYRQSRKYCRNLRIRKLNPKLLKRKCIKNNV